MDSLALYGGKDPRDLPRYYYSDAARATGVPASTIGAWVRGQPYHRKHDEGYFEPVIQRPDPTDERLSYYNIIEIHVLRYLRTNADPVKLNTVREAIAVAEQEYGVKRLLIDEELRHAAGELFLEQLGELGHLSRSGQLWMREMLRGSLKRIEWDQNKRPTNFGPVGKRPDSADKKLILVSPFVSFGSAIVERRGISTHAIRSRFEVGEERAAIIADYRLKEEEFDEAILYETAA